MACNLPFAPSLEQAQKLSHGTGKPLLVIFTGSDWSPRSITLDKNILEHAVVEELIIQSFVPVLVDFPQRVKLNEAARSANLAVAERFNVTYFPTVLALRADGTEIGRLEYVNETAEAMEKLLSQWSKGHGTKVEQNVKPTVR